MLCGWEGNRRSDVALVCVSLSSLSIYSLNGLDWEMTTILFTFSVRCVQY